MHLLERYSLGSGAQISEPYVNPHFYPVPADKYVVFHASAKDDIRNYSYWPEVLLMLKPLFEKNGWATVQIGVQEDPLIGCDIDLRGRTSLNQLSYVVKNSHAFLGVDSFPAHLAGYFNKRMLAIYSNSYIKCCEPKWGGRANQKLISTYDRAGRLPSFANAEHPKTINLLFPDVVAREFCEIPSLSVEEEIKKTIPEILYIGPSYKKSQVEIVPDHPYQMQDENIFVRMDIHHDEDNLREILKSCKSRVLTTKALPDDIINSKRINSINYICDSDFDEEFIKKVVSLGIDINLISKNEKLLSQQRAKFFDHHIFFFDQDKKIESSIKSLNKELPKKFQIASNKKVVKNKAIHNSFFEANGSKDLDDLFLDLEWVMLYNIEHE